MDEMNADDEAMLAAVEYGAIWFGPMLLVPGLTATTATFDRALSAEEHTWCALRDGFRLRWLTEGG